MEKRTRRLRRLFSLLTPRRRDLVAVAVALALLPALLGVAAAQPVVVHRQAFTERIDTQVIVVFDTTLSMSARTGPAGPSRLDRAKREAASLVAQLGSIPAGIATLTDRVLPSLMPTTNTALFLRILRESVRINEPPPSQFYRGRGTSLSALFRMTLDRFFSPAVKHPILVVFSDGEAIHGSPSITYDLAQQLHATTLFVHVWAPTEHLYVNGRIDPRYRPDPTSGSTLEQYARDTHGRAFAEGDVGGLLRAIRSAAGTRPQQTVILGYSRVALGQWFLLAGVVPLGFLFWRRNL